MNRRQLPIPKGPGSHFETQLVTRVTMTSVSILTNCDIGHTIYAVNRKDR